MNSPDFSYFKNMPDPNAADEPFEREYTPQEEAQIEARTAELMAGCLADSDHFADLLANLNIGSQLYRIFINTDKACKGDPIARDAMCTAASQLQTMINDAAKREWLYLCEEQARGEMG